MTSLRCKDETLCYEQEKHFSVMKSRYERSRQCQGKQKKKFVIRIVLCYSF